MGRKKQHWWEAGIHPAAVPAKGIELPKPDSLTRLTFVFHALSSLHGDDFLSYISKQLDWLIETVRCSPMPNDCHNWKICCNSLYGYSLTQQLCVYVRWLFYPNRICGLVMNTVYLMTHFKMTVVWVFWLSGLFLVVSFSSHDRVSSNLEGK